MYKDTKNSVNNSNENTFNKLLGMKGDYVGKVITYKYNDGTSTLQKINPKFVISEKGDPLRVGQIVNNIEAIRNDLGATSFEM